MRPDRPGRVETNLAVQQEVFERAYSTLLNGLKFVDKKFLENLKGLNSETEEERKKEVHYLQKTLLAIVMVIQKLKHNIRNEHFVENHDTDYFKEQLTSIQENLLSFKGILSEQLQTLLEEEKDIQQSIDSLQQRLTESSTTHINQNENSPSSLVRVRAKPRVCSHFDDNVHPDVQEFNQFLQNNGGHTGGWDTKDHLLFTRFLQKYRGLDQMTTVLLDFMPDKTPEEIAQHESWYHDYLTLKDAQRRALKEWKEEQATHKQTFETTQDAPPPSLSTAQNNKMSHQRDPAVKEKIKQWKEKQEKLRQQQIEALQEKKRKEQESWKKKVAYFEQQRKIIAENRKSQDQTQKNVDLPESSGSYISKRHIPLKEFWEQDKLYMQRRQSRLQRFSASPRERSSSQSTVQAERDPARLLRPTAVWRARIKRSLSEDGGPKAQGNRGLLYIVDVPHLAKPKWREGLV